LERIAEHRSPELLFAWIRTLVSLSDFGGVPVHHFIAAVSERHDEMAYGMVGVVTGYWLR